MKPQRPLSKAGDLTLGGLAFIFVFASAYIAEKIMSVAVIVMAFGAKAYSVDGLRVTDWKHSTLSNGTELKFPWDLVLGVGTLVLWAVFLSVGLITASRWIDPWVKRNRSESD